MDVPANEARKTGFSRVLAIFTDTFGLSLVGAFVAFIVISAVFLFALFWFFHSAPPDTITITSGTPGSAFETNAIKYGKILARNGVKLKILSSQGSLENLQRLNDPKLRVDIGFVQGGVTNGTSKRKLVSLGSVSYQPLVVFYRGDESLRLLSELAGKKLAVGAPGSGTHTLALSLLQLNGIQSGGSSSFVDLEADEAAKALLDGTVDAVFLMGDSASRQVMRELLRSPGIQILDFTQADAYVRRIPYLNKLLLPKGAIDFAKNIPDHDVSLIGPTVELLARADLHPAISDLLLEAAQEVHGGANLLQRKGEFPAAVEHDFPISTEAVRYYKSGKSFFYRSLPFRLASLMNRILVSFVPIIVLMIPALRVIPPVFRLRVKLNIYRWYRALLALEREHMADMTAEKKEQLLARLNHIEQEVNKIKVPASFADQFYALRGDIGFVRGRLAGNKASA
jgi:TRAP-type uncharacterized transport system substrate-binding protein